jgi:hypothetical protein
MALSNKTLSGCFDQSQQRAQHGDQMNSTQHETSAIYDCRLPIFL